MRNLIIALAGVCLWSTSDALDQGCSVTLYDGSSLDGTNATFVLGEYTKTEMIAGGFPDNSVSSLRVVGARCVVTIFNGENLEAGQWNKNYPEGEYPLAQLQLRGGYDNQVSSIRVWRTACAVTLFEDANFLTTSFYITLTAATYTRNDITSLSGGSGDNIVSSIRVAGPRCSATAYDGENFNGAWSVELPEGDYTPADLVARGAVDKELSSVAVAVAGCVATIYDDGALDVASTYVSLLPGDYDGTALSTLLSAVPPDVSSLRVSGYGCTATLYQTNNLDAGGGWAATFEEGDYPLAQLTAGGAVDNQMQSIRVAYTASDFDLFTDTFGSPGNESIESFFPASIGDQWTWISSGLTLSAGNGAHQKAILRSVAFTLAPNTIMTIETGAGGVGSALVPSAAGQGAVVENAGAADAQGFLGIAINDFDTNMYRVSKRRSSDSTLSESIVFGHTDLNPFAYYKVTVDIVDAYLGGYMSISSIHIAVACAPISTTDACQFDVVPCAAVMPGTACLIYCQGPYEGTASAADCPAGNTDPTTPLIYSGMPNCRLPCPNPTPLPTGYTGSVDLLYIYCDTANGYTGTATKTCTMDSATCTTQQTITGCSIPVATVAGDPITYYGNQRSEFKIPVGGMLTPLLEVPDMRVLASAVQGRGDEQWLDRVLVTTASGQEVLSVTIKDDLFDFNRSLIPANGFETLNVKMDWLFPTPLAVMPPANEYYIHWHGLRVAFGRARGALTDAPRRELAMVVSQFASVYIASSSANEYYEHPYLAYKYAHLDFIVGQMRNASTFTGLLPELWGLAPPGPGRGPGPGAEALHL
mmetsp:Transcript_105195/g.307512  ORF Transcript_105195/g.307512 Transcript_105195/m.307512 type:complete len:816 (-) Transcript_105195:21-2468(-)